MTDTQLAALTSIFRALLAMLGGVIIKHGWANSADWQTISEGLVVLAVPLVWGPLQKFVFERNTQARVAAAYNAGATNMPPPPEVANVVQQGAKP